MKSYLISYHVHILIERTYIIISKSSAPNLRQSREVIILRSEPNEPCEEGEGLIGRGSGYGAP